MVAKRLQKGLAVDERGRIAFVAKLSASNAKKPANKWSSRHYTSYLASKGR